MSAVPKNDIEEDDRGRWVERCGQEIFVAEARIDHRVRPAHRVLVVAQIEDLVGGRALGAERCLEDELRLAGERAAAVQATDPHLPGLQAEGRSRDCRGNARVDPVVLHRHRSAKRKSARDRGRRLERGRRDRPDRTDRHRITAKEVDDDGLAGGGGRVQHPFGDARCGRLGDQDDDLGPGVGGEPLQPVQHHRAADTLVEVATADPDRLRHAGAGPMDEAAHLLEPGTRCGDEADGPAANSVREAERDAVDDRRPAVGPHEQQALPSGDRLELDLVLQWDVVTEQEDVEAALERLHRLGRGVRTGRGDEREIGRPELGDRLRDRPGVRAGRLACAVRTETDEALGRPIERGLGDGVIDRGDGDDEIIRAGRGGGRGQQAGRGEHVAIRGGGHDEARSLDPIDRLDPCGDLHQLHRIAVAVGEDTGADDGHQARPRRPDAAAASSPARTPTSPSMPEVAPHATARSTAPGRAASSFPRSAARSRWMRSANSPRAA